MKQWDDAGEIGKNETPYFPKGEPMETLRAFGTGVAEFMREYVAKPFRSFGILDLLDILLLAIVLYEIYRFTRNRRAGRVLAGFVIVILVGAIVTLLRLPALTFVVRLFASSFFFCIVLIFQPEIRDALEKIGNSRLAAPRGDTLPKKHLPLARSVANETVDAVFKMSKSRTGALIVFEGLTKMGDYTVTGKPMDAAVSSYLLQNIFFPNAPLHDGAVVIRNFRICAASCVLPSTKTDIGFGNIGTRHRAAVGVTEVSDALVVIVSEQTGTVSVAQDGKLLRGLDEGTLYDVLMYFLAGKLYYHSLRAQSKALFLERLEKLTDTKISEGIKSNTRREENGKGKGAGRK